MKKGRVEDKDVMIQKIKMRIKGYPDADLIFLRAHKDFNFEGAIRQAVIAYVRGYDTIIHIPKSNPDKKFELRKEQQIFIQFNREEEGDVIDWIMNIKTGYRNIVLKSILRNTLNEPNIYGLICGDNWRYNTSQNNTRKEKQHNVLKSYVAINPKPEAKEETIARNEFMTVNNSEPHFISPQFQPSLDSTPIPITSTDNQSTINEGYDLFSSDFIENY